MYDKKPPLAAEEKDWYTATPKRPPIVCLCGSTRFEQAFKEANTSETLAGKIVLQPGHFTHTEGPAAFGSGDKEKYFGPAVAAQLEELYRRKIELADEVLVLNVNGYIGASTWKEIQYARSLGKVLRWLVDPNGAPYLGPCVGGDCPLTECSGPGIPCIREVQRLARPQPKYDNSKPRPSI